MMVNVRTKLLPLGVIALAMACGGEDVRYGEPGGLRAPAGNDACPIPDNSGVAACPDFATAVFAIFDNPMGAGCTDAGCHGVAPGGGGLFMPSGDAQAAYQQMSGYLNSGRPLVSTRADDKPYLLCNLNPDPAVTVGSIMPPSATTRIGGADLATLAKWVECGMQLQGGGATGGAGGGGGAGGVGGGA